MKNPVMALTAELLPNPPHWLLQDSPLVEGKKVENSQTGFSITPSNSL